jgi:hypothetical protein
MNRFVLASLVLLGATSARGEERQLAIRFAGTGFGVVRVQGTDVCQPQNCFRNFPGRTRVTLQAEPQAGSTFARWQELIGSTTSCAPTQPTCQFQITAPSFVTAVFDGPGVPLTVQPLGNGTSPVTSSPPGINCSNAVGSDCSQSFPAGTQVTLSVANTQTNLFQGWTGGTGSAASCSGSAPCSFALNQPSTLSALIVPIKFKVRFSASGEAPPGQSAGSINVLGTFCLAGQPTCEVERTALTSISVEALPGPMTRLKSLGAPCTPVNGKCSFQLVQDTTFAAIFELLPVSTLTIGTLGNANGLVRADSLTQGVIPNINCRRDDKDTVGNCSSSMPTGTVIKLTATPEKSLITQPLPDFKGWFDGTGSAAACNGKTTTTCQFTLSANSAVKAKFCRAVVGCLTQ